MDPNLLGLFKKKGAVRKYFSFFVVVVLFYYSVPVSSGEIHLLFLLLKVR